MHYDEKRKESQIYIHHKISYKLINICNYQNFILDIDESSILAETSAFFSGSG